MNTSRHTEVNVLGYRIDHVLARPIATDIAGADSAYANGLDSWREVLCPLSGGVLARSEERRVGKECTVLCRSRWSPYH